MRLEELPPDILSFVLNGQNSLAAIELWKCGNRNLNSRMANHGVTHMELHDEEPVSTSKWPRCLKEFKLTSLSIHRIGRPLASLSTLLYEIKQLHKGLKSLELRGSGIAESLFGDFNKTALVASTDSDESEAPASKRSKTQEVITNVIHTERWNMGTTWPQLERLIVSDSLHDFPTSLNPMELDPSILSLLPNSLTYLGLAYNFVGGPLSDASFLPRGLTTVRFPDCYTQSGIKTLPKTVTDLGPCISELTGSLCLAEPELLPHFKFPGYPDNCCFSFNFFLKHEQALSTSLQYLQLRDDAWPHEKLPSSLTFFHLSTALDSFHTGSLALLPRGLTTLRVTGASIQWHDLDISCWPSTLAIRLCDTIQRRPLPPSTSILDLPLNRRKGFRRLGTARYSCPNGP